MTPTLIKLILVFLFCGVGTFILYGIWKLENDRYNYRQKHGIDPKYHGWDLENKNDTDKDQ